MTFCLVTTLRSLYSLGIIVKYIPKRAYVQCTRRLLFLFGNRTNTKIINTNASKSNDQEASGEREKEREYVGVCKWKERKTINTKNATS